MVTVLEQLRAEFEGLRWLRGYYIPKNEPMLCAKEIDMSKLARLLAVAEAAAALLVKLPEVCYEDDIEYCPFCETDVPWVEDMPRHKADCPWLLAKAAIAPLMQEVGA